MAADRFDALVSCPGRIDVKGKPNLVARRMSERQRLQRARTPQDHDHRGRHGGRCRSRQKIPRLILGPQGHVAGNAHAQAKQRTQTRDRQHHPGDAASPGLPKRIANQVFHGGERGSTAHGMLPSGSVNWPEGRLQRTRAAGGRITQQRRKRTEKGQPARDHHGQAVADLRDFAKRVRNYQDGFSARCWTMMS